jgi:hypothetical protein
MWLSTGGGTEGSSVATIVTLFTFIAFLGVVIAFSMGNFSLTSLTAAQSIWELTIITGCAFLGLPVAGETLAVSGSEINFTCPADFRTTNCKGFACDW